MSYSDNEMYESRNNVRNRTAKLEKTLERLEKKYKYTGILEVEMIKDMKAK